MSYEPPIPRLTAGAIAEEVTAEWRRRTVAEYTSAAIAQQVTLWLIQLGAPPDLIRDGLRIVDDELAHSELSAQVADSAAGDSAPPAIDPVSLILPGGDPAMALVSSVVRFFCIGETIAVPLFRMLRQRCSIPIARTVLDRVLRDEARHRQFGWDVLDWTLLAGGDTTLELVADQAPGMLHELLCAYLVGESDDHDQPLEPEIQRWGMASPSDYRTTVTSAVISDVLPRFAARGITPSMISTATVPSDGGLPRPNSVVPPT